ncbi:aminodeoxychorismate synthase component I [Rhizobium sp. C4]|uniref:aminodeoxychorismate synthase component I n=1 Tax=Rhizobium sp. C4 TaxID=1349800 RepID=UPI001E565590|nr:aminodeoxychorismate synthase component I [Rhizobium sp. C4]MCD2174088.1 aminodeoxychorismate synthase component I [Rhizobium sp. C4]
MSAPSDPFLLLRDDLADRTMLFARPREIVRVDRKADFFEALERLQAAHKAGHWLAGSLSYEAGHLFEPRIERLAEDGGDVPYLLFGIFDAPDTGAATFSPRGEGGPKDRIRGSSLAGSNLPFLTSPRARWNFETYQSRFETLHHHLRKGDSYQGNLTFPIDAEWHGDPLDAFEALAERQPVKYGALVNLGGPVILSRSPELFFKVDADGWIETHPMKGTAARGATPAEDAAIIEAMKADEKTQVENRIIVDLLRNDISRIAQVGTLSVPKLFDIETYPTLHQMVSHVRAKLLPDTTLTDIFAALFPCGSITGAPKMWTMEILHRLEQTPRGAYCGAIGHIAPSGEMLFNVAIRTITLFADGKATFNVGGGIVFDSKAEDEYAEALLKARFAVGDEEIAR